MINEGGFSTFVSLRCIYLKSISSNIVLRRERFFMPWWLLKESHNKPYTLYIQFFGIDSPNICGT